MTKIIEFTSKCQLWSLNIENLSVFAGSLGPSAAYFGPMTEIGHGHFWFYIFGHIFPLKEYMTKLSLEIPPNGMAKNN